VYYGVYTRQYCVLLLLLLLLLLHLTSKRFIFVYMVLLLLLSDSRTRKQNVKKSFVVSPSCTIGGVPNDSLVLEFKIIFGMDQKKNRRVRVTAV